MPASQQASLWSQMAEEARAIASRMQDPKLRLQMLAIAAGYEALSQRAEAICAAHAATNARKP